VPALTALLDRALADPAREDLAAQALAGVIAIGVSSIHRGAAMAAIRRAATSGSGEAAETASSYLRLHGGTQ